MLAVAAFVAFWVILAFGLFFVPARGGLGGARATLQTPDPRRQPAVGLVFMFMLLVFGIALPAALLIGNHDKANGQVAGIKLTTGEKTGRELFGSTARVCHTLAAANAVGKVGPNLDTIKPADLAGAAHDHQRLPAERRPRARPAVPRPGRHAGRRRAGKRRPERGSVRREGRRKRVARAPRAESVRRPRMSRVRSRW